MSAKVPLKAIFDGGGNATDLAEFVSGDYVPVSHGGTGLTSASAGSILVGAVGGGAYTALSAGAIGDVLTVVGGAPSWSKIADANVSAAAAIGWSKISKTGSSIADLATRSVTDLTGTVPSAMISGSYAGITLVGTLSSLAVSGNATVGGTFTSSGRITATHGTEADFFFEKTGANANSSYLYNAGAAFGSGWWDDTNARNVWKYELPSGDFVVSRPTRFLSTVSFGSTIITGLTITTPSSVAANVTQNRPSNAVAAATILQTAGGSDWAFGTSVGGVDSDFAIYSYGTTARVLTLNRASGLATFANRVDVNGSLRVTGGTVPTSGTGIEMYWNGTQGIFTAIDRATSVSQPLFIQGSQVKLQVGGADALTVQATTTVDFASRINAPNEFKVLSRTSDASTSSNVSPGISAGLSVSIGASQVWKLTYDLFLNCSGAGGVKINIPTFGGTLVYGYTGTTTAAALVQGAGLVAAGDLTPAFAQSSQSYLRLVIYIAKDASAGSVDLKFRPATNTQSAIVYTGSSVSAERIS